MIKKSLFGKKSNKEIYEYTLTNSSDTKLVIITLGAALKSIFTKDKNGNYADIITGFDTCDEYMNAKGFAGAIVGRVCNRIANAKFTLNGVEYVLYNNDGKNQLHGGREGFQQKVWSCIEENDGVEPSLKLQYVSVDGEENYPGTLCANVKYTLTCDGSLKIEYSAKTDKETPVSMTNHAYFNLSGYDSGVINDNVLWVDADNITDVDDELIPTGKLNDVTNTPFDFRCPKVVGSEFNSDNEFIKTQLGFDNNYVINNYDGTLKKVAELKDNKSGRKIEVISDQPCLQVYTSNMIDEDDIPFKNGVKQYKHCAVCLETQKAPDSVNHPDFTNVFIKPGEEYKHTTIYKF